MFFQLELKRVEYYIFIFFKSVQQNGPIECGWVSHELWAFLIRIADRNCDDPDLESISGGVVLMPRRVIKCNLPSPKWTNRKTISDGLTQLARCRIKFRDHC